jgi:hypothetical protein
MKPDQITAGLVRLDDNDIDQILELNILEYGAGDILTTRADFEWRYSQNPAGEAIVLVIRHSLQQIVGFIWLVPVQIRVNGQDYLAATGTNLLVHPNYRHTFGYVKLLRRFEQTFRDRQIPFHFSFISEEKYQQLRKQRPETAWTIPLLVKPLNFKALFQRYFNGRWQQFIGGQMGRLISPFFSRRPPLDTDDKITVHPIDTFEKDRFDQFWMQVRDKYSVMLIRNSAFLSWRFAPISGRCYHLLVAEFGDQIIGYAVLKCATIRGVQTGLILDFLVSNDAVGIKAGTRLLVAAEQYFQARNMLIAAGLMAPFTAEYQIMRRCRYQDIPPTLSPRPFRFAAFAHHPSIENQGWLSSPHWFITLADYEAF